MSVTDFPGPHSVEVDVPRQAGPDRTPPQDLTAEQCVLGSMLLSKDAIADVVEMLRGVDFYRPAHETVYDAVLDLYGRGEPADAVTVAAELQRRGELARIGGAPYLHTLIASVPSAANGVYYAEIVREKAVLRRLVDAGTKVTQLGYTADGDVDDLVDRAQAEIYNVTDKRGSEDYAPLSEVMESTLDEIEAIGTHGGQMIGVPTGFTDLDALTNGLHPGQLIVVAARPGLGKALALDTPLPTPTGWTTMEQAEVGDLLIGADGKPTRVVAATDVMNGRPCYEVVFSDGTRIVADAEHQWLTETRAARKSAWAAATGWNRYRNQRTFPEVRTTEQIAGTLRCLGKDQRLNHAVLTTAPLDLPDQELPLAPYVLGVWLGDGTARRAQITTVDNEIVARIEAEGYEAARLAGIAYGIKLPTRPPFPPRECVVCGKSFRPHLSHIRTCGRSCGGKARFVSDPVPPPRCPDCGKPSSGLQLCVACRHHHGSVQAILRTLGVLRNKHIPAVYLRGSLTQRRALLAGLLDTDGTVTRGGSVQLSLTSKRLIEDARELIVGLGYRCSLSAKRVPGHTEETSTAYTLTFSAPDDVFRLERKHLLHKERRTESRARTGRRYIADVRPVPSVPVRCVQVDSTDSLYLASRSMIPTHNSVLGLNFARAASIHNDLTSVIFSLEMGRNEITMRLLSAEAGVPLSHMRQGTMTDDDWARLARKMGEVSSAPLFIDDSPNMTMMEIRAKCRRLRQRHDLRLIIVDYLQLMTSGKRVESRQLEVSEFSRSLKLLAKELDVPLVALSQLNRGPEQRTDHRPLLADLRESGCLTADTRLLRADTGAEVTLGELLASGARDIPVWSLDDRLKLVPRNLTHAFPSGVKEVYRLRLASGRQIEATANHPFLTYDGWKPLGELVVGCRLAALRSTPPPLETKRWDDDEVVLLAHLIGDGSFVRNQPIRYASVDEANLQAVADAARRRFGITAVRDEYPAARVTTLRLPAPYRLARGRRNPIAAWLDGLGLFGLRSHEKFVPADVFSLSNEQISLFLRHLWATDGCLHRSPNGQVRIYYGSTSLRLVDDIARLLLRSDIFTRVKTVHKSGYRDGYHLHIVGAENQARFLEEIGVHGHRGQDAVSLAADLRGIRPNTNLDTIPKEVWERVRGVLQERGVTHREFALAMGTRFCGSTMWKHAPSRTRLARVAGVLDDADLEMLATNDVYWDTVVSVEPLGLRDVYDATVLGTHNFIANGIPAHNSIEQDSDMVILLHRDDAYERESSRPGEADFIVAKHRNGPTANVTVAFQGHYQRFVDMAHG